MKIIFLGTNGWYTSPTGNTPCVLLDSKDQYVVFDAGNGIYKLDSYITEEKPIALFISHFHIDHVSGLHTLNKFAFQQGIDIYVGPGRSKDFETLVNPPFTIGYKPKTENVKNLSIDIRLHELSQGENALSFPVTVKPLFHAFTDHGYRVTLEDKHIVYTGDTGKTDHTIDLAKDADILIHECSYQQQVEIDPWGHVDSVSAAQIAKDAHVGQLILTHFDASKFTTMQHRKEAEEQAKTIFPNTLAATDDLVVSL